MLKGVRFHRYRPKGVANVVNRLDSLSNSMCQNPLRTSKTLKTFASVSSGNKSSNVGRR